MRFGFREIVFVALMIGLLAISFLFFKKTDEKRARILSEIHNQQTALNNLHTATAGISDLNKKIEELQQAISFFESKLPQEKEMDKILKEVWQMAEANALATKTVRTSKSERAGSYSEQPITMSLAGDFNGFYTFLLQLEKLPRLTRITQMNLQKISDHEGEMTAQMTLSIFFEPDTGSSATAAAN
jgi:type IV pilus assembly protein PilO